MKSQEKAKIHQNTRVELEDSLINLRQSLATVIQMIRLGKESNTKKAANLRRQIAVIKTIIRENELKELTNKAPHETA